MLLITTLSWSCTTVASEPETITPGIQQLMDAYVRQQSNIIVEVEGTVDRVLPDDMEGSRHQRFILRLPTGITVLVSHNIDLAPRIETLQVGDAISLQGEYEWNELGGIIHWTHHDPNGEHPGGWIVHRGRRYE
jgi:hypothetical protein